ncbi:MAG: 30S ribosomal protein S8 [Candidatus Omnitrophica bacterium]|nr:30S ribosomal protein S8 [Candidatus Omnitrophota bacterium]
MISDIIADQLTVVRNAIMAKKKEAIIKKSGLLVEIVKIMKREGFIEDYQMIEDKKQGKIKIYLKWQEDGRPVLTGLKKISKIGRREYITADEVKSVMGGVGLAIISTSKGLLTDKEAKEKGVGGEVICQVW